MWFQRKKTRFGNWSLEGWKIWKASDTLHSSHFVWKEWEVFQNQLYFHGVFPMKECPSRKFMFVTNSFRLNSWLDHCLILMFPQRTQPWTAWPKLSCEFFGRQEHTADSLMKALPKGIIEIHRVFDGWPTGSCCVISYCHCYDLETVGHDKGWQSIMCLFALTYWRFELVDWPELLQDKNNLLVDKDAIYMYMNLFCNHTVNIER